MSRLDELEAMDKWADRRTPWSADGAYVSADGTSVAECIGPGEVGRARDAALIAAARNALPDLLIVARSITASRAARLHSAEYDAAENDLRAALARLNGGAK